MTHPTATIDTAPLTMRQIVAIAVCIGLNALDGFDVLAISFAAPGIAADWGIDRAALGVVLSMELIGMALGSVALGAVADRIGRRPVVLLCLAIMAGGMAAASLAAGIPSLLAIRFGTGIGIGGMLACTNAVVAEVSNARRRPLMVALMAAGYPLGAVIGGTAASALLATGSWRQVFELGAVASALFLPLAWALLPETVAFLTARGAALDRVNHSLRRYGHAAVAALPPAAPAAPRVPVAELFAGGLARTTLALTAAYFAQLMTFYFMLKWIPKIVVDMGYSPALAGGVLVWANVGGLLGGIALSLATIGLPLRRLMVGGLLGSFALVAAFGRGWGDLATLSAVAAAAGFFTNACMVGLYALLAAGFPATARAGGTGFVIGVGRGGAALGPIAAGAMFQAGNGLQSVALVMAGGSLVALLAILALPRPPRAAFTG